MGRKPKDIAGQQFGSLLALRRSERTPGVYWWFLCDCGRETEMLGKDVFRGPPKGRTHCGCLTRRNVVLGGRKHATHMMSGHPVYAVWRSMKVRCTDPNHRAWKN